MATLAEWLSPLALATDAGAALPAETAFRTALVGLAAAERWGETIDPADVYFGALLRHLGCTTTAADETRLMGDEQELRSSFAVVDAASPLALLDAARKGFGVGKPVRERVRRVARFLAMGPREVPKIFAARCEVAVHLAARIGLGAGVRRVLDEAYERYDGKGAPHGKRGDAISPAARLLGAAEIVAICARLPGGEAMAKDLLAHRRGTQVDPAVVDLFVRHWADLTASIRGDVRGALLAREPRASTTVDLDDADVLSEMFADFVDLKSPFTLGHSRMVATAATDAAREMGLPEADQARLRRAGLLHDLGRVAVSNAIWDKPGPLTDAERDTMRDHATFTERILSLAAPWKELAVLAASDHERTDGSGYPRSALVANIGVPARILAAADVFSALVTPRPHRPAFDVESATRILREEAARGRLDRAATDAVLAGRGLRGRDKPRLPAGISERELQVLRLLARGLVDKEIAERLGISHRTVHHHNQSLFAKIGVSTRGAAALYAVENGLL